MASMHPRGGSCGFSANKMGRLAWQLVPRPVDFAHIAGTNRRENLVGTELGAKAERHRYSSHHSELAFCFLHPLAVHVAVLPVLVEAAVVLAGSIHLAAVLVDLAQEVEAADVFYWSPDMFNGAFYDPLEPFGGCFFVPGLEVGMGKRIPDRYMLASSVMPSRQ